MWVLSNQWLILFQFLSFMKYSWMQISIVVFDKSILLFFLFWMGVNATEQPRLIVVFGSLKVYKCILTSTIKSYAEKHFLLVFGTCILIDLFQLYIIKNCFLITVKNECSYFLLIFLIVVTLQNLFIIFFSYFPYCFYFAKSFHFAIHMVWKFHCVFSFCYLLSSICISSKLLVSFPTFVPGIFLMFFSVYNISEQCHGIIMCLLLF